MVVLTPGSGRDDWAQDGRESRSGSLVKAWVRGRRVKAPERYLGPVTAGVMWEESNVKTPSPARAGRRRVIRSPSSRDSYLVDPASSHMLVSKIKPCMSKYKQIHTVKLRMAH